MRLRSTMLVCCLGLAVSVPASAFPKVDLQVPLSGTFGCSPAIAPACIAGFTICELNSYLTAGQSDSTGGLSMSGIVYVTQ